MAIKHILESLNNLSEDFKDNSVLDFRNLINL